MIQIPLYTSLTAKLDGLRHTENLSQCSLAVKFQSGTCLELELRGQPLRLSEVERLVQNLLLICFNSPLIVFRAARGRRLSSIECHDLCCKIAQIVVVGGVRRSALISLSNLTDDRIRRSKSGQWWVDNPQRGLANNSACYTEKPDFEAFLNEWKSLYESRSGERGVFSRVASQRQAEKNGRRDATFDFGTNPCSEIILRPYQFCNLSEVVVRANDTLESLRLKVRSAAILGTLQATLTDFRYLRKIWKDNTEEEALLGVSLTGIMDHPVMSGRKNRAELQYWLTQLKEEAIETNRVWAERLGINVSTAITAVKPSGTVSQLVDSASGIHPRYAEQYITTSKSRRTRPLVCCPRGRRSPCGTRRDFFYY